MTAQRRGVPVWRRISVRLGLLVAVAMWAFVQFEPPLTAAVSRWFGIRIHDGVTLTPDLDGGCMIPEAVSRAVADHGTGESAALVAAIDDWPCFKSVGYVVTAVDMTVLGSDLGGSFPVGAPLVIPPEMEVSASFYPIWFDPGTGELGPRRELRWLCLLPRGGPYPYLPAEELAGFAEGGGVAPDGTAMMTSKEFDKQLAEYLGIERIVRWSLPVVVALLLATLVSWRITRRLVRISNAAGEPDLEAFERAGVRGKDEIGTLAAELASSRSRIAALLREVEDKDAQRREWFAQVSHDLRTPLTALGACLERAVPLADGMPDGPARDKLLSTIEVARHDAERVHVLANDLLDAARLELPNALRLEEVPPVEVAERAVQLLSPLAEREGKRLVLRREGEPGPVMADGNRLLRVFENLIRNGIHFAAHEVVVEVRQQDDQVRMTVLDDGPGFSDAADAAVEAIKTDPRGRDRADSAGLGLVVVARTLVAHGVDLELDDRPEGGARLSFALPCLPEPTGSDSGVFRMPVGV